MSGGSTDNGVLSWRGARTVPYPNGRGNVFPGVQGDLAGRSHWGFWHELLINDVYGRLDGSEPFWISPAEAEKSLRIVKEMAFTAAPIKATRAEQLGIINHVVPAAELDAFTLRIAQQIAANPPLSLPGLKEPPRHLAGARTRRRAGRRA